VAGSLHPNSDPASEAWAAIASIFMSDENQSRFHAACDSIGISPPALKLLLSMQPGVGTPMRAFADKMRCDASWVTSLVDDLEALGLVERRILPTDRRVKTVLLTRRGLAAQAKAQGVLHNPPASIHLLSAGEQRQLRDLLRKLADTLPDSEAQPVA
jgi:DNA-binding MarR family transcriptional regulator